MISKGLLAEFDHEMATTRTLLERVPEGQATFRPHPKSFDLASLAVHLANIPMWAVNTMRETELEVNPPEGFPTRRFESTEKLLEMFDTNVKNARDAIAAAADEDFRVPWSLKNRGNVTFTLPRIAVLRGFVMNHHIHHRGQLSVYLRMCDVPLPSIYGPTADMA
ncbi:MAG TPA: DinB family protein [Thermoanaerobaculia bacterium]|nr:DinB family protein [Thermoanaerobaculia bacterium]